MHDGHGDTQQPSRRAHKVLNNNVVISVDASGRERVLMGRGLGFGMKPSDEIDPAKVEKTFVLSSTDDRNHAHDLLTNVPYEVVTAVTRAIDVAERSLGRDLGRHIGLAVIDHVHFVIERMDQGQRIPTANLPGLRVLFPDEYATAQQMSTSIGESLGRHLPPEESVFLTMHLLNATRDEPNGTAALLFRRVNHVIKTVESGLGVSLDPESAEYARFVLHVQFLLQRLVSRTMLRSGDSSFFDYARGAYPRAYDIALRVKEYVSAATGSELTDEEVLYLIVHVERLSQVLLAHDEADADKDHASGTDQKLTNP